MGSVRHRLTQVRHECNVVLVGDVRVGKSALVNRFINNKFNEVSFFCHLFELYNRNFRVCNEKLLELHCGEK